MSFMVDSGWYLANFDLAEPFFWGKGEGHEFISKACKSSKKFREFCY